MKRYNVFLIPYARHWKAWIILACSSEQRRFLRSFWAMRRAISWLTLTCSQIPMDAQECEARIDAIEILTHRMEMAAKAWAMQKNSERAVIGGLAG